MQNDVRTQDRLRNCQKSIILKRPQPSRRIPLDVVCMDYCGGAAVQGIHVFATPARIDVFATALQLTHDAVEVLLKIQQHLV